MDPSGAADPSVIALTRGGDVVGRFHRFDGEPPSAELFEPQGDTDLVVDAVLTQLAGWNLTTTHESLADALVHGGATPTRHFSLMSVDLRAAYLSDASATEGLPGFVDIRPLRVNDPVPPDVVSLVRAAYPVGHPDEERGSDNDIVRDVQRAQTGGRMGPLMDQSALFFDGDRLVAMVLVNRVPGSPPLGGPWVTDVCRIPEARYAGVGRSILLRVMKLLQDTDEPALSLAVTEGNPARRLYESLGFSSAIATRKVLIPN